MASTRKPQKRRSEEDILSNEESKKADVEIDNENINGITKENDAIDHTLEYELDDSIGFDGEALQRQYTQEYSAEHSPSEEHSGKDSNMGKTPENSQALEIPEESTENHSDNKIPSETDAGYKSESMPDSTESNVCMTKYISVQRDAEAISNIVPNVDVDFLYEKILENRNKKNRIELVTNEVFDSGLGESSDSVSESSSDDIFKDVASILIKYPNANPNKVYDLLEKHQSNRDTDRVASVLNQLSNESLNNKSSDISVKSSVSVTSSDKSTDLLNDPEFKKNPLYRDVKTLHRVLPDKDPNELYAYLEAHFNKPNRVQIVLDELAKSDSQESLPVEPHDSFDGEIDKGKLPVTVEDKLQTDVKELREIFPDCDPNYVYEQLHAHTNEAERVRIIAAQMFDNKDYPKLNDVLEKEQKEELKRKYKKMNFNMKDFLLKFPKPFEFFSDKKRQVNLNYKAHVVAYMKNTYPFLKDGYIKKLLEEHNHHLAPTVGEVEEELPYIQGLTSKKLRATPRTEEESYPEDPEELFFQELMYCQHRQAIKDEIDKVKQLRDMRLEEARNNGELHECGCCFDDECLFDEMQVCADGHLFCKECIVRSCEVILGQGKTEFMCLTGTCEHQFALSALQEVLPPTMFSLALRKMQEEEIRRADIPDLVACPFCAFATIMPDPDDKVFKCLNSECLKESCRLCREPNHVPLKCSEVEKTGETSMRAYIEMKMSEAMLRTCPNCKKRFYKEDGCNKMTCTCGTTMCYVCREADIDYEHFDNEDNNCEIDSEIFDLHNDEMVRAAEEAKAQYLKDHPESTDKELLYDPVKLLEKLKKTFGDYATEEDDADD